MNKISNKLILGGAQISTSKYGITNKTVLKKNELKKIFDFAQINNIKFIDTAKSYKNSENIIGNSNKNFHVITKLSKFPSNQITYKKWIANQVFQSLKNLKTKKIYAILIHSMSKLTLKKLIKIIKILNTFKKKKIVKFIGISIYDPEEINFFWKSWKPDIIQVPYNIFDRRIETSGWLKILKKNKIEIHARSVLMQGLLINKKYKFPKNLSPLKLELIKWFKWCKKHNIDPLEACIRLPIENNIDKIILGVNSMRQLKMIVSSLKYNNIKKKTYPYKLYNKITDPRNWAI